MPPSVANPPRPPAPSAREAYERLAPLYDRYTDHPHYVAWIAQISEIAACHGARRGRLLDLGCGTGASLEPMVAQGWEAVGCDISPAMLALARSRLPDVGFVEADMRDLPDLGRFDLIWTLNDPVHYLESFADVAAMFAGVARSLDRAGVFVFDANTRLGYERQFVGTHARCIGELRSTWTGRRTGASTFEAVLSIGPASSEPSWTNASVHVQRFHATGDLLGAVEATGLMCVQVAGQLPDGTIEGRLDEHRHVRALFFAVHSERR